VLVVVDEAHLFAPEKGHSEALSSVIDLATRGRKREFAAVLATQRISKLHKDAAAECLNKLIGRTGLDIDMKRASDELGFTTREQLLSLRDLDPGEFFAFGPAISKSIVHIRVGEVRTVHGKAARKLLARMPVPTEKVKQVLSKLADLPKQAEEEVRDRESLVRTVRDLERQLRDRKPSIDETAIKKAQERGRAEAAREFRPMLDKAIKIFARIKAVSAEADGLQLQEAGESKNIPNTPVTSHIRQAAPPVRSVPASVEGRTFGQCERKILGFLSLKPGEYFTKVQIGAMTGYRHGSGGFNNALSNLTQAGLILRNGGSTALNPDADVTELIDSTPHTLRDWINKLGACERAIYQALLEEPDTTWSKQEMGERTGYSAGSGGFNNALSRLNTLGLMCRHHDGRIGLNPDVLKLDGAI
jgi:hypothetical protein